MTIQIRESVAEAPTKKGNRWRVIVARPGQGSSGNYSEDLFRRDAEKLIPAGAQSFINHGERDPEKMIGVFPDGGYFDEDEKAVVAELQVFEHWKSWVEEVAPYVGMSLYAMGEADEDGNVTAILEDAYNGADVVARPGLSGSGIADKLYEQAIAGSDKTGVTSAQERKETVMDKELLEAIEAAVAAAIAPLVASEQAAKAEAAQAEADEKAVAEAVASYDAAVKAIDDADLPKAVVESLRTEARAGKEVAPLIENAKAIRDAVKAEAETIVEGRVLGEDTKFDMKKIAEGR